MNKKGSFNILQWVWWMAAIPLYGVCAYPAVLLLSTLHKGSLLLFSIAIPMALLLFILNLLIAITIIFRFVPKISEGEYPLERNGEVLKWMVSAGVVNLVRLLGIQKIIYANPLLRRLYFFAFRAKVHPSAIISYEVVIADPFLIEIGPNAKLGEMAKITGHYSDMNKYIFKKVVIEEGALIGAVTGVLPGVTLKKHSMVGAGSLVNTNTTIPERELWLGKPARKIKNLRND